MNLSHSVGVLSLGLPCLSNLPTLTSPFFTEAMGPRPHFLGYTSRSMMTLLSFATKPWSHVAMVLDVMRALARAIASPLVDMRTISSPISIPLSNLNTPEINGVNVKSEKRVADTRVIETIARIE